MKLQYYGDTDTLSIEFKKADSIETSEIAPDVTVDYDAQGNVISIDIDLASEKIDLASLETLGLPFEKNTALKVKMKQKLS
ncbi:MAG: DUF2283 domain-containing protein [Xenococcaceae cyanobacterium]|nr:hypothetical protein B7486_51860 [cyanobacterium TDX16]